MTGVQTCALPIWEKVLAALVSDSWRLQRAGALILAEELRLSGDIQGALARSGVCDDASDRKSVV